MALIDAERRRWREVLTRLVAIIRSLAERNIALRWTTETLYKQTSGNFLEEVEVMAQFDPILRQHVVKVEGGTGHTSHLDNSK